MKRLAAVAFITLLISVIAGALIAAAGSPLLAWRDPVYIVAGLAGVVGLVLLLLQPLLAAGLMPGLLLHQSRRVHRWVGGALLLTIVVHVVGLWLTSPPDVIDALLFTSPTPFSVWGVLAMWGVLLTALLAAMRRKVRVALWRASHKTLAVIIVVGTVVHAMLIEGTMEVVSKSLLCVLVMLASAVAVFSPRVLQQWWKS